MHNSDSSPPASAGREEEIRARVNAATPGPWKAGRADMQSYDGNTGEAFTNVYADNPFGRWHMGARLPHTVARALDESGRNKEDAAFIAHARADVEWLLDQLASSRSESSRLREAVEDAECVARRLDRHWTQLIELLGVTSAEMAQHGGPWHLIVERVRALVDRSALSPQPKEGA